MKEKGVHGVAITGSVARLEPHVHDIDLIVFHGGGRMIDATCTHDSLKAKDAIRANTTRTEKAVVDDEYGSRTISVEKVVTGPIYDELSAARKEVPIHYIFVYEKILSDCNYLQSFLPPRDKGLLTRMGFRLKQAMKGVGERLGEEFYATVFGEIPLLLIDPINVRGAVLEHAITTSGVYMGSLHPMVPISHQCSDARCKPRERWMDRRVRVKTQQGYTCVAEEMKRREAASSGLSLPGDNSGALSFSQTGGEVSLAKNDSNEPT